MDDLITSSLMDCPEIVQLAAQTAISNLVFLPTVSDERRLQCMYTAVEGVKRAYEQTMRKREVERIQTVAAYLASRRVREKKNDKK